MSDYTLLVADLHRLSIALRKAGYTCRLEGDGTLVTTCTLETAKAIAHKAGIRISQQWPPSIRVPLHTAPPAPADKPEKEAMP
jgi:hypothetical protein